MKKSILSTIAVLMAMAPTAPSLAQTNPDPWYDVFNGPHAQTLAILAQHANASILDPDFKAKIEALGPSVQVVDVQAGHQYFYEGFSQNAPVDNYYYLTGDSFGTTAPRHPFGTGPLAKWQPNPYGSLSPPTIINVDGSGPLGEPQMYPQFWTCLDKGYRCSYLWEYNQYNATGPTNQNAHYAMAYKQIHPVRMFAEFTATASGNVRFSSYWDKINVGGVLFDGIMNEDIKSRFNWQNDDYTADGTDAIYSISEKNGPVINGARSFNAQSDGNWGWTKASMEFPVIAGKTYKIDIQIKQNVFVDEISVTNLQTTYKTIANPFYKPPNTGPTIGGFDLSNITEVQFQTFNKPHIFDPNTTIYFPPIDPQIGPGPCCGPFSELDIPKLLVPTFPNGANGNYTMQYTPNANLNTQMAAYLTYIHTQDPTITTISIEFSAANLGTANSAASFGPFVSGAPNQTLTWTWTPNGVTMPSANFWAGAPLNINSWYGFMAKISHNGTISSPFFNANCTQNWWRFRGQSTQKIMVNNPNTGSVIFQTMGSDNRVTSRPPRQISRGRVPIN